MGAQYIQLGDVLHFCYTLLCFQYTSVGICASIVFGSQLKQLARLPPLVIEYSWRNFLSGNEWSVNLIMGIQYRRDEMTLSAYSIITEEFHLLIP